MDDLDYNPNDETDVLSSDNDDNEDKYGTDTNMDTVHSEVSKKSQTVTQGIIKTIKTFMGTVFNIQGNPAPSPKSLIMGDKSQF